MAGGLNVNLVFSTTIVAFGLSFLYGYNIGVLNQPKQLIVDFFNETYRQRYGGDVSQGSLTMLWSLTTALFIPGGIIGSLLGGWLADAIGRKRTTLVSHIFTLLGAGCSCACVAASAPELLMLGRVLVGINSGLVNCVAPMVLSETCPHQYRGAFGTVHQLSVTVGIFLSSVFGMPNLLGTVELWPYLILLQAIPAIISLAITPFMPDTPRYLMIVKHHERAAEKAMQFYRRSPNVAPEMEEMSAEGKKTKPMSAERDAAAAEADDKADVDEDTRPTTVKRLFMDRDLRQPLFIACALVTIQQFSGINAVFFYSQSIFENAQVQAEYIPYAVIATNAVNVIMTLIAVPLMDVAGRRPLLLIPMTVMIVDLVAMTISLILQQIYPSVQAIGYVSVVCVVVYVICFAAGLGPIPMFIGSELFRQGPRPKAMAVVGIALWAASFVIAIGFEPLQAGLKQYTFIVFIVFLFVFLLFLYFFVPETKNKTFEQIASQFASAKRSKVDSSKAEESKLATAKA